MLHFILQTSTAVGAVADSLKTNPAVTGLQPTGGSSEITETKINILSMVMKGGPIMIPLALLLAISIYILIERLLVIGKAGRRNTTLLPGIKEMINTGNISNARSMCKNANTPESTMLEQGVARIGQPVAEIREAMNKSGSNEIGKLEKNLNVLNIIVRIAPMF
jgi:biopolymer transport protein ExbB